MRFSTTTMFFFLFLFLQFIRVYSPSLRSVWLRCTLFAVSPLHSPASAGSWWISGSIRLPSPHLSGARAQFKPCSLRVVVKPGPSLLAWADRAGFYARACTYALRHIGTHAFHTKCRSTYAAAVRGVLEMTWAELKKIIKYIKSKLPVCECQIKRHEVRIPVIE